MASDYIIHHGTKGQKWGVRRFQNSDGSLTEAGRARYNKDTQKFRKKSDTKNISTEELKEYNNRLRLEQEYDRLLSDSSPWLKIKNEFERQAISAIASIPVQIMQNRIREITSNISGSKKPSNSQ